MDLQAQVRRRFGQHADAYATSHFHANQQRLAEVIELVRPAPDDVVLDVATGTGHAALALAPHVAKVVGLDLSPAMLERAVAAARGAGLKNITWIRGDALRLPFADGSFDAYVARSAPHHFVDLDGALREALRVLRPGGRIALIDCSPPEEVRDFLHAIEITRDATHVLSRTVEEWVTLLEGVGFKIGHVERRELYWRFANWMQTANLNEAVSHRLERAIAEAPPPIRAGLRPEHRDGSLWHRYWHVLLRASKPAA
jgi:ubiquinone/menaquinone biosynthesis C-methylase UbiE